MSVAHVVPLAEAAAFTLGCWVLRAVRGDPDRLVVPLVAVAVALALVLLIGLTPEAGTDAIGLDPEGVAVTFSPALSLPPALVPALVPALAPALPPVLPPAGRPG